MPIGGFPLRAFVEPKKNRDFKSETKGQVPKKGSAAGHFSYEASRSIVLLYIIAQEVSKERIRRSL